eukprot:7871781-Pyramimonas_sp.AAC.1
MDGKTASHRRAAASEVASSIEFRYAALLATSRPASSLRSSCRAAREFVLLAVADPPRHPLFRA